MKKTTLLYVIISLVFMNFAAAQGKLKAIKAGGFIDVTNGSVLKNQIILIQDDSIIAVGSTITIPKDAEIIDLSNATVLPGLIDCHTHITSEPGNDYYADIFRKGPVDNAIMAPTYAKRTLEASIRLLMYLITSELVVSVTTYGWSLGNIVL